MRRNRSVLVALAAVACAALVAAVAASADDGGRNGDDDQGKNGHGDDAAKIFTAALAPSQVGGSGWSTASRAGGAPWALQRGRVQLAANGKIKIETARSASSRSPTGRSRRTPRCR